MLKTIGKLGECDFDTLQKYSGIEKETLKKMLILGLTGTNDKNSVIVMDSNFKNISLMPFGEDVASIPIEEVITVYDEKLGNIFAEREAKRSFEVGQQLREEHQKEIKKLRDGYEKQLSEAKQRHDERLDGLKKLHEENLQGVSNKLIDVEIIKKQLEIEMARTRALSLMLSDVLREREINMFGEK